MKHQATAGFWRLLDSLPAEVQELARKNFELLRSDPRHPSLHFKHVGALWSARIGLHYRALARESGENLVWFWVGDHAAYDRLVGRST